MALIPYLELPRSRYFNFQSPERTSFFTEHIFEDISIPNMEHRNAARYVVAIPEILIQIFTRLPPGQLLRLRAISKYWHDVLICDIYPKRLPYFLPFYTTQPRPPDLPIHYNRAISDHMPGWNGAPGNNLGCRLVNFPVIGDDAEPPYVYSPLNDPDSKTQIRHFNAMRYHSASWLDMQVTWPPSRKIRVFTAQPDYWYALPFHPPDETIPANGFFKEIINPQGVTMKQLVRILWSAFAFRISLGPLNSDTAHLDIHGRLVSPLTTYGMFQQQSWLVQVPRNVGEDEEWWREGRRVFDGWDGLEDGLIDWWKEIGWWGPAAREVGRWTRMRTIWE